MKLEQQVVNIDLAMQLKELGVKQDSLFRYAYHATTDKLALKLSDQSYHENDRSAFTVSELGEMLPAQCSFSKYTGGANGMQVLGWKCRYFETDDNGYDSTQITLADAMALMLVELIKVGVVKI